MDSVAASNRGCYSPKLEWESVSAISRAALQSDWESVSATLGSALHWDWEFVSASVLPLEE